MKYLLTLITIIVVTISSYGQDFVKYQGAKVPLGTYWKVIKGAKGTDAPYFQSKMKTEHIYFYVKYLGENLSNEEKARKTKAFIKELGFECTLKNPTNMRIGTTGVAATLDWKQNNSFDNEASYRMYLYETRERRGKTKNYILVYEEECEEGYKQCNRYIMHRESYEKEFSAK